MLDLIGLIPEFFLKSGTMQIWHQTAMWISFGPLLVGRGSVLVLSASNLLLCLCPVSFVSNLCFVLCLIKVTNLHYIVRNVVDMQPVWQCVGSLFFETLVLGLVIKQSWLKKSFKQYYTLCLKFQLHNQPLWWAW